MDADYKAALDVVEHQTDDERSFVCSNGLKLRLNKAPLFLLRDATMRLRPPKPPMVEVPEKGRKEENPNDPDYQQALIDHQNKVATLGIDLLLMTGVTIVEVPSDLENIDGETWPEVAESLLGEPVAAMGLKRRMAWLKYYAVPGSEIMELAARVAKYSGATMEVDVAAAQMSFRPDEAWDPAVGIPAAEEAPNGISASAEPAGDGASVRGTGGGEAQPYQSPDLDGVAL